MSLIPTAFTVFAAELANLLNPIFFRPRSIGPFIADVTLEETEVHELSVTEHPVEIGAPITDHAYLRPATVTIRAGWSNSSRNSLGNPNYVQQIYDALQDLQASREPFEVVTGKRSYEDMLITRLIVTTDEKTENALAMTCELRQVLIVSTQTVQVPPASAQSNPEVTQPTLKTGPKQLIPASNVNLPAL